MVMFQKNLEITTFFVKLQKNEKRLCFAYTNLKYKWKLKKKNQAVKPKNF